MGKYLNTAKTTAGFLKAFIARRLSLKPRAERLEHIYNYLAIEGLYATSGQPSEAQLGLIARSGYERVINLAPKSVLENSVVDEADILQRLGLEYIHIPVDFKAPSDADFEQFVAALEGEPVAKTWVHCAANMRVSAFTYRYRVRQLAEDEAVAQRDLHKIWQPAGVWRAFVDKAISVE